MSRNRDVIGELEANETPEVLEVEASEEVSAPAQELTVIDVMEAGDGQTLFTVAKNGNTATLAYKFGADIEEMVELFGDAIVYDMAKAQMIVKAQAVTRPLIAKGISAIDTINSWMPGVKRTAMPVDKKAVATSYVDSASLDELEAMLVEINAKKAALV